MSNLVEHAKRELELAWPTGQCEMQDAIKADILALVETFAEQGHSGTTAPYCLQYFQRLANFKNISPLTGADSEWVEVGHNIFQNNRCGEVFKEGKDGQAYWSNGKIFREPDGCCYSSRDSRVDIEFPWVMPDKPEYVDVPKHE
jgi:hypothetical protein